MFLNRSVLMKVHTLLAVFLMPVAVMFFVTGALYIWDIKGEEEKTNHIIKIKPSFSGDISEYILVTKNKLKDLNLSNPTGQSKIRVKEGKTIFEWKGAAIEVRVETNLEKLTAKMEVKKSNWYRHLVQLHKSKGGFVFKVYSTILSIALLTLILSGFIMAWQIPKLRKLTITATFSGFFVFILLVISS